MWLQMQQGKKQCSEDDCPCNRGICAQRTHFLSAPTQYWGPLTLLSRIQPVHSPPLNWRSFQELFLWVVQWVAAELEPWTGLWTRQHWVAEVLQQMRLQIDAVHHGHSYPDEEGDQLSEMSNLRGLWLLEKARCLALASGEGHGAWVDFKSGSNTSRVREDCLGQRVSVDKALHGTITGFSCQARGTVGRGLSIQIKHMKLENTYYFLTPGSLVTNEVSINGYHKGKVLKPIGHCFCLTPPFAP